MVISMQAAIREMVLPGTIALLTLIAIGFLFGPELLGGTLAGVMVSSVLMAMFQRNAGGAWDDVKKSFDKGVMVDGKIQFRGSEAQKAIVTGDTIDDPCKGTSGPSINILIKLMSIVSLVIARHTARVGGVQGVVPRLKHSEIGQPRVRFVQSVEFTAGAVLLAALRQLL